VILGEESGNLNCEVFIHQPSVLQCSNQFFCSYFIFCISVRIKANFTKIPISPSIKDFVTKKIGGEFVKFVYQVFSVAYK